MKKKYRIEYRMKLFDDSGYSEWRFSRSYATEQARDAGLLALKDSRTEFEYRKG
jgi:hypothetical protein